MLPRLNDQEKQCIRILAKMFAAGEGFSERPRQTLIDEGLEIDYPSFIVLMRMMEEYGVIEKPIHIAAQEGRYWLFEITAVAVQLARELDETEKQAQEPRDIVGHIQETARKHPVWAYLIIGFFVLTAVVTFANQATQFLERIGMIKLADKK